MNVTFQGDNVFRSTFDYLDDNRDSEVSKEELNETALFHEGPFDGHYDEFSAKYWPIFDTDNSETLNFEETMYFIAAIYDGSCYPYDQGKKIKEFLSN